MKILIISHTYVVAVNQQKIAALAKIKDLEVSLLVPDFWKAPLRETPLEKTTDANYEIISLPVYYNGQNDKFFFPLIDLYKVLRKVKPDLIQLEEEPWSFSSFEVLLLAKILKIKVVFFTWENLYRRHSLIRKLLESFTLKNSVGAIAGNQEAKEILENKGFKKPLLVLPQLGIEEEFFKKDKEKIEEFIIGFIGRLDLQKGIMTLLEAFNQLDFPSRLLLVGSGPLKEEIDLFIKEHNLVDRVEVIQGVTHDQVPSYLSKLSVLILPSLTTAVWKEQFGHVLVEAMAAQVPVIGSSSGAIPEVIGESGLIFKEGDVEQLAKQIKVIYADKKLASELVKKGEKRVKEEFSQERIAKKTYSFYREVFLIK